MSQVPPVTSTHVPSHSKEKGKVQAALELHCANYPKKLPIGCNLVVMQGKSPAFFHAGNIVPNGPQHFGSTAKQFTAACIDLLVKQGAIKYDDDIRKLCPDLPEFKLNGVVQKVTVDDVLHMRSGLPETWALALMVGVDGENLSNKEHFKLLDQHPGMVFAPGTKEMYCNTNYYILSKIVEDVTGRPFVDYVQEEILAPLDMQARHSLDPLCPETIPGYGKDFKEATSNNCSYGTTGLIGPPSDMAEWNTVIGNREYNLLEPPKEAVGSAGPIYCRGLIIDHAGDYFKIFHGGALAGFNTIYRRYEHRDPNKTFAFFLTTNVDDVPAAEKTADAVANALAGTEIEPEKLNPEKLLAHSQKKDAAPFGGTYRCEEFGNKWIVTPKEIQPGKWAVHMIPKDNDFPAFDFDPQIKEGQLVFGGGYPEGTLELTDEGFIYNAGKMAPVHFTRID